MKRKIIKIDEDKCNGCGLCVPNCAEGALQIIDGKARLISDLFCDGLGACLGHCPEGAIEIEEREAEPYDERVTMKDNIIPAGKNTIMTHLHHLHEHQETEYLKEALEYLKETGNNDLLNDFREAITAKTSQQHSGGCPGARMMSFGKTNNANDETDSGNHSLPQKSELQQWPVQLHLLTPTAPYLKQADLVLAADCVAFAMATFHQDYLKGKSLAIACPKLDDGMDLYIAKLTSMIDDAKINTITVVRMEVPCCGGLTAMAKEALSQAKRKIPLKEAIISIQGEQVQEEWI